MAKLQDFYAGKLELTPAVAGVDSRVAGLEVVRNDG